MRKLILAGLLLAAAIAVPGLPAADWGDLTLTFKYDGPPPSPRKLLITKDQAVCGKHNLVNESLVVHKENKGIRDVVAYLYVARGRKQPPVHPSYAETANAEVKLDNNHCRFEPHVQILRTTQTLMVLNSDTVGHNTNITTLSNDSQNILIPGGAKYPMKFPVEERFPSKVACNIHPWMNAIVVVRENPYGAVSDEDGKLTIPNVPAGKWTFQFWHDAAGYVQEGKQDGKSFKWRRGRVDVTIKAGENDLGEIKLAPQAFKL